MFVLSCCLHSDINVISKTLAKLADFSRCILSPSEDQILRTVILMLKVSEKTLDLSLTLLCLLRCRRADSCIDGR